MKNKLLNVVLSLILILTMTVVMTGTVFAGSYTVNTWEQLEDIIDDIDEDDELDIYVNNAILFKDTIEIDESCKIHFHGGSFQQDIYDGCSDSFIEVDTDDVTLTFDDTAFLTNSNEKKTCDCDGSAIYVDGNDCVIDGADFFHCATSDGDGGAIYVSDNDPGCRIKNCRFMDCYASDNGGCIYNATDDCEIINCEFQEYSAGDGYGCVYGEEKGETLIKNCTGVNSSECYRCTIKSSWGAAISGGNIWVVIAVAVAAIAAIAVLVIKKKKRQ